MNKKSQEQRKIDSALSKLKKWYIENEPTCIFCLHLCTVGQIVDLCHKIRRSETVDGYTRFEIQTLKLNTGLGHRTCHHIFDNIPEEAVKLPGFPQVMKDIQSISQQIYNKLMMNVYQKWLNPENL